MLSACAPGTSPVTDYPGVPTIEHGDGEGHEIDVADGLSAMWLENGGKIAVTTFGSSSCPVVGTDISVVEPAGEGNTVEIAVAGFDENTPCTMDLAPHTTEFWTPMNVTTTEELTVMMNEQTVQVPIK